MLDLVVTKNLREMVLTATIEAGQGVVALVGPSGGGKTTLLRMIAGLSKPDDGRILIDGRLQTDCARGLHRPPGKRGVGVVFQDYALFPHLSVGANVAYGLRARGVNRVQSRQRSMAMLDQLGLDGLEHERPAHLSGGQRQRVALARALVLEPRVLLLDEPLAALDVQTRTRVRADLHGMLGGLAIPTLLVTHDPADMRAFGQRIIVLEEGRIVQDGPYADLVERPATAFVGEAVDVNYYRGLLEHSADGAAARVMLEDDVALEPLPPTGPRGPVAVTIPPWDIRLRTSLDGLVGEIGVMGRVVQIEPIGGRLRVTLTLGRHGRRRLIVDTPVADVANVFIGEGVMLAALMSPAVVNVTRVDDDSSVVRKEGRQA